MKPFGIFLGAAVLLLGILLYGILIPAHWAAGFRPGPWFTVTEYVLGTIVSLAGVYMVRIYMEEKWIRVALTLGFSAAASMTLYYLAMALHPNLIEEWYYLRAVRSMLYLFSLLAGIFVVVGMLNVQAKEIRAPFRWLGRLGVLEICAGFMFQFYVVMHWPHPAIYNTMFLLAIPGRVISIWLNYRFWRGELGRTAGWEKEVATLGEEV